MSSANSPQRAKVSMNERERRIGLPESEHILATARTLIAKQGISAVRQRDIAKACGLSETATLYYFGTKARMLIEILRADHNQRLDALRARLEPCSTREQLVDAAQATLEAFLEERTLRGTHELLATITYLALDDPDTLGRRAQLRQEYLDVLARLLGDKQRAGVVRLSAHATAVAGLLISLAQGFAVEIAANPAWRPAESIQHARVLIERLLQDPSPAVARYRPSRLVKPARSTASQPPPAAQPPCIASKGHSCLEATTRNLTGRRVGAR